MRVKVSEEVRSFLRTLAPVPRRMILRELHKIERSEREPEPLEHPLEGFCKIRAGGYRILCVIEGGTVFALFADRRSIVYEVASAALLENIARRLR